MADKRAPKHRQTNKRATDGRQTIGKRASGVKPVVTRVSTPTPERVAFARRLHAGYLWCGMSWPEIGARLQTQRSPHGMSGESVSRLARETAPIVRPPTWQFQRDLETTMGLPTGYLNGDVELPPGRRQTHPTDPHGMNGTRAGIEEHLALYERRGANVAPRLVRIWLDELTAASAPATDAETFQRQVAERAAKERGQSSDDSTPQAIPPSDAAG